MAAARQRNTSSMQANHETTSQTPLLEENQEALLETDIPAEPSGDASISTTSSSSLRPRVLSLMLSPFTDEQDSLESILVGIATLTLLGSTVGAVLPKNTALPSPFYRTISSMMGYTCFCYWSVSFYPQMIQNFRRRTTIGLSADFCALNVLGFACYAVYNLCMFYSVQIQNEYRQRHGAGAEITVQSNDVAFAVHSFLLATITLSQIAYFDGVRISRTIFALMGVIVAVATVFPLLIVVGICHSWLDYLYLLSFVKILVTLIKYIPQVILNVKRQSTSGFSIWQILLDLSGGILNNVQQIGDSADLKDWSGLTGNPAKLCLGFVSIIFDIIFMTQHYVLYKKTEVPDSLEGLTMDQEAVADDDAENQPLME